MRPTSAYGNEAHSAPSSVASMATTFSVRATRAHRAGEVGGDDAGDFVGERVGGARFISDHCEGVVMQPRARAPRRRSSLERRFHNKRHETSMRGVLFVLALLYQGIAVVAAAVSCAPGQDGATGTCVFCVSGTYCPGLLVASSACPAGSYCATPTLIVQCSAGTYCPQSSTSATVCPAGSYCSSSNAGSATLCTQGCVLVGD